MQAMQGWQLATGLWFSQTQQTGAEPVAVIGDTVARNLFAASGANPVGQKINMFGQLFRVVGVLAPIGGFRGDDVIFVP
jgi:putative ABC transport system permease protein